MLVQVWCFSTQSLVHSKPGAHTFRHADKVASLASKGRPNTHIRCMAAKQGTQHRSVKVICCQRVNPVLWWGRCRVQWGQAAQRLQSTDQKTRPGDMQEAQHVTERRVLHMMLVVAYL